MHTSASWAGGTCEVAVTYTSSGFTDRVQPLVEVIDAISSPGSTHLILTYGQLNTRQNGDIGAVPYSGASGDSSYQLCDIPDPNV